MAPYFSLALILPVLTAAVFCDLHSHRIPNRLCAIGLAAGLIGQFWSGGSEGLLAAVLGAGAASLAFMPFYVLRGMGAGDVKLLMGVGSILGPKAALFAAAFSLIAGGLGAIGFVLLRALQGAALTLGRGDFARVGASIHAAATVARRERLPFALPIAVGSLAAWWQQADCADVVTCLGSSLW